MLDVRVSLQFQAKHKTCHADDLSSGFGTAKKIYGHIKFFFNLSLAPKQPATAERMHLTH